jgi:hypothetical protein
MKQDWTVRFRNPEAEYTEDFRVSAHAAISIAETYKVYWNQNTDTKFHVTIVDEGKYVEVTKI